MIRTLKKDSRNDKEITKSEKIDKDNYRPVNILSNILVQTNL